MFVRRFTSTASRRAPSSIGVVLPAAAATPGVLRGMATARRRVVSAASPFLCWTVAGVTAGVVCTGVFCATKGAENPPFDYKQLRKDIESALEASPNMAPTLVRLAWHQAGIWDFKKKDGHPNSASMRFEPECAYAANAGLKAARDFMEKIKKKHPQISYADLWALGGTIAIEVMGGPTIPFRWGRTDSAVTTVVDGRLPDASQGQQHIRSIFSRMGFNDQETVALIGAHAVGECHKAASGYVGPWTHDRLGFTNSFFTELLNNEWVIDTRREKLQYKDKATESLMMLPADVALLFDKEFRKWVDKYAKDADLFNRDFGKAWQKLVELGVEDKVKSL